MALKNISDTTDSNFRAPGIPKGPDATPDVYTQFDVRLSDAPAVVTETRVIKAGQNLRLYEVVAEDSDGKIVKATKGARVAKTATTPIGIMAVPINVSASGSSDGSGQIYRAGHFNGDALVWDSTFTGTKADSDNPTAAELLIDDNNRIQAFWDSPAPTNIIIAFNKYWRKRNID